MYEVHAGNVGMVYRGLNQDQALRVYYEYVDMSANDIGRAAGQDVVIFREDGSILFQHWGKE